MSKLKKIQKIITLSCLVNLLVACQLTQTPTINCKPTPPSIEWYTTEDGGIYITRLSFVNLELYLNALNNCIDDMQSR